jgi:hypothetical protein
VKLGFSTFWGFSAVFLRIENFDKTTKRNMILNFILHRYRYLLRAMVVLKYQYSRYGTSGTSTGTYLAGILQYIKPERSAGRASTSRPSKRPALTSATIPAMVQQRTNNFFRYGVIFLTRGQTLPLPCAIAFFTKNQGC